MANQIPQRYLEDEEKSLPVTYQLQYELSSQLTISMEALKNELLDLEGVNILAVNYGAHGACPYPRQLKLAYNGDIPTEPKEKTGKRINFLSFAYGSVLNIPPNYHVPLLFSCCSYLIYQAKNFTDPFDLQLWNSTKASQSMLSLEEAFTVFFVEMAHMTKFMLCYILTLILILQLHLGVQIVFMLLLISAPVHYFPALARKASGINVACSSFKLPLFWVTIFGATGLSVMCVLLAVLMLYFSWRFIHKGRPIVKEIEVDDLSEILVGV